MYSHTFTNTVHQILGVHLSTNWTVSSTNSVLDAYQISRQSVRLFWKYRSPCESDIWSHACVLASSPDFMHVFLTAGQHVLCVMQCINGYPIVGLGLATCAAVAPPSPVTLFLLKHTQLVLCGLQSQCNHIEINPTMKMQGD